MSATIRTEREGSVATVVLDRPARRNAFDAAMADALSAALAEIEADASIAAVVLRGEGRCFCAGWDLDEIAAMRGRGSAALSAEFERNRAMLNALAALPQPVIAAPHGAVAGFGFSLVARADLAVAAESTRFALPEVRHRVVPAMVMLDLLDLPNRKLALSWLLSGATVSAAEALAGGLVSELTSDEAAAPRAAELAAELAALDPGTLRAAKALFRRLGGLAGAEAEAEAIATAVAAVAG